MYWVNTDPSYSCWANKSIGHFFLHTNTHPTISSVQVMQIKGQPNCVIHGKWKNYKRYDFSQNRQNLKFLIFIPNSSALSLIRSLYSSVVLYLKLIIAQVSIPIY